MASSGPSLDVCDILQERIKQISFIDDAENLKKYRCCACGNVAISRCIANCGDVFCTKCYLNYYRKTCPNCETKLTSNKEDDEFESSVLELKVKCKYTKNGCEEVISVIDFLKHIKLCKFASDKHLLKLCRENPVPESPQQVNDDFVQNKEVMDRMQTEFTNLKRKVEDIERSAKTSQDQNKEEMEKLESRHKKRFNELESKLMSTCGKNIAESDQHCHADDYEDELKEIFMWKISGFKEKWEDLMEDENYQLESDEFFYTRQGLRFKLMLTKFDHRLIGIELDFFLNRTPSSPFLHSRKFVLLDQKSTINKQNVELIDRPMFKKNSATDTMEPALSSFDMSFPERLLEGKNNYVKNDEILIQIILEPISILWKQIESRDGVFLWRIDDYSKKKKDAIDGVKWCLISKPFKTSHVMGYTAYLQLFLNGFFTKKGKYISMYVCFTLGEHDSSLPRPVKCKCEFSLLDQSDSWRKKHIWQEYTSEFKDGYLACGFDKFVPVRTVESWRYLKNDSILIRTTLNML